MTSWVFPRTYEQDRQVREDFARYVIMELARWLAGAGRLADLPGVAGQVQGLVDMLPMGLHLDPAARRLFTLIVVDEMARNGVLPSRNLTPELQNLWGALN